MSVPWVKKPLRTLPARPSIRRRQLRLNGLIRRLARSNRYVLTQDGVRIAVFSTEVYNRLLVPLTAANQPQAPPELRAALRPSPATSMTTPPAPGFPGSPETLTPTSRSSRPKIVRPLGRPEKPGDHGIFPAYSKLPPAYARIQPGVVSNGRTSACCRDGRHCHSKLTNRLRSILQQK